MTERMDTYSADDDLLPIGDVAKALGVSIGTVRRWDRAGSIEAIRTPGGQRRFRRSEVQRLRTGAAF